MDAESSRRPTPSGAAREPSVKVVTPVPEDVKVVTPVPEEATSSRFTGGNGHAAAAADVGPNPAVTAAKDAAHYLNELKTYAGYFVSAKVDGIKASVKRVVILAGLGVVGLFVVIGILFSAAFLLLAGIANGLGALFGHHMWLGQLVTGLLVLGAVGAGAFIALKKVTAASKAQTELKYASKRNEQRVEFGHDVHDRAGGGKAH